MPKQPGKHRKDASALGGESSKTKTEDDLKKEIKKAAEKQKTGMDLSPAVEKRIMRHK